MVGLYASRQDHRLLKRLQMNIRDLFGSRAAFGREESNRFGGDPDPGIYMPLPAYSRRMHSIFALSVCP